MRGDLRLGFRQLATERWAASPLYTLRFTKAGREKFSRATGENGSAPLLKVRFEVKPADKYTRKQDLVSDRLSVRDIESNSNNVNFNPRSDLELELNTMLDAGLSGDQVLARQWKCETQMNDLTPDQTQLSRQLGRCL